MSIDQTDSKQKQPISSELQKQISMELDQIRVKPTLVKNTPQKCDQRNVSDKWLNVHGVY